LGFPSSIIYKPYEWDKRSHMAQEQIDSSLE
jgi:hypothetical protein